MSRYAIAAILSTAAAAAALVLAGCSADVSRGQGTAPPPTKSALTTVVLHGTDLPGDWEARSASSGGDNSSKLADCAGTESGDRNQLMQVHSSDFVKGNVTISSDASSYRSSDDVDKQLALLTNPKTEGCLNSLFRTQLTKALPSDASIENASVTLDTTTHHRGITNLAGTANGSATIVVSGQTVQLFLSEAFITGRKLTASVSFTSDSAATPSDFTAPIVAAVAKRASRA